MSQEIDSIIESHILKLSPQGAYEFYCKMLDRDADEPKPSAMLEQMIKDRKDLDIMIVQMVEGLERLGVPQGVRKQFVRGVMWRIEQEAAR